MTYHKFLCISMYIILLNVIFTESDNIHLHHILLWTSRHYYPFDEWKYGQEIFLEKNCTFTNCYITDRRDFFGKDVTNFDAIVFNGRNLNAWKLTDMPKERSPHQKYIYFNMESSDYEPLCGPVYDGFFNMTATYKLDSDILFPYIIINNMTGEEVGPRINMTWIDHMSEINQTLRSILEKKTKAAAWFVSNCKSRSDRYKYARQLKAELKRYNLDLDIYGKCGDLKCPRSKEQKCHKMLQDQYYFYLSFENSFSEDYVTEKLLTALQHSLVPIVYGGANYSRFLPPGSYLDARLLDPHDLAARMARTTPAQLYDYFRWRNHYTYHDPYGSSVCSLCAVLNNNTVRETHKVYEDFRGWWNPDYMKRCNGSSTVLATPWLVLLVLMGVYWGCFCTKLSF